MLFRSAAHEFKPRIRIPTQDADRRVDQHVVPFFRPEVGDDDDPAQLRPRAGWPEAVEVEPVRDHGNLPLRDALEPQPIAGSATVSNDLVSCRVTPRAASRSAPWSCRDRFRADFRFEQGPSPGRRPARRRYSRRAQRRGRRRCASPGTSWQRPTCDVTPMGLGRCRRGIQRPRRPPKTRPNHPPRARKQATCTAHRCGSRQTIRN